VLAHKTVDLCAPGEDQPFRQLVADVELGDGRCARPSMRRARRSRTSTTLLRTFDFMLGYEPDQYLEIEEGQAIRAVA
jgi:hypothetical protein